MSKTLIEMFEPALICRMMRIGADVAPFADGDEFSGFRFLYGGMPSEWRTNLSMALKSLTELEQRCGENEGIEETREVIYSIWNAMRRSDDAALKRVLRYAVNQWPVPQPFPRPELVPEKSNLEAITVKAADVYRDGGAS